MILIPYLVKVKTKEIIRIILKSLFRAFLERKALSKILNNEGKIKVKVQGL